MIERTRCLKCKRMATAKDQACVDGEHEWERFGYIPEPFVDLLRLELKSNVTDEDIQQLEDDLAEAFETMQVTHVDVDVSEDTPIPLTRVIREAQDETKTLSHRIEALTVTCDVQGRKLARIADVFGNVKLDMVGDPHGALEVIRSILLERNEHDGSNVSIERMALECAEMSGKLQRCEAALSRIHTSAAEGPEILTLSQLREIVFGAMPETGSEAPWSEMY